MIRNTSRMASLGCSALALAVSAGAFAPNAQAQSAPAAGASAPADASAGEIVVTANKREQNLNKIGVSVAAFSGESLRIQRVTNVADLALATPGLTFAPTPNATPVYTLRGVGFYDSSLASYPDVSLYIDQAPLPLPIMSSLTAFDLERVEVLKGPQGTLFGNNATGGAINFVAAKPTNTLQGGGTLSYGRFNTIEVDGYISGPLSDTLKARVAVHSENGDPWQYSYTRNDKTGKTRNIAGRAIVDWEPSSDLKFSLNLNGWRDEDDPQAPQRIGYNPQNNVSGPPVCAAFTPCPGGPVPYAQASYPNAPMNARAADWTPSSPPSQDNRFYQATLRGDYKITPDITLTSITGYSHMKFKNTTEGGGTALVDLDLRDDEGSINSFTQELRLANSAHNRLRWVLGANLEATHVYEETWLAYKDTSSTYVNGIVTSSYWSDQHMHNYAGFGNLEFDVNSQITLKGGIRQTKAKRDAVDFNGDIAQFPIQPTDTTFGGTPGVTLTDFFNALYGALSSTYGGPGYHIPTIAPGGSIVLDTRGLALGNPAANAPVDPSTFLKAGEPTTHLDENSTSWSVGAEYKPATDVLLYATVAQGYKAGSSPQLSGAIYSAYAPVVQESLRDYEIGFKTQMLDRKLSITGAAFWYDYKNKQTRAKFVDPIFGALDELVNVPKSTIKGVEMTVNARPVPGLSLSASGTYLDAKVDNYNGIVGQHAVSGVLVADTASYSGVTLPFSPKFQYSFRADYDFAVSNGLRAFVGAGVNGQSSSKSALVIPNSILFGAPTSYYDINARALVNGDLGIGDASGRWKLMLWGKNLFNKYYWTSATQAYDTFVRYTGRPAEYGVQVSLKF